MKNFSEYKNDLNTLLSFKSVTADKKGDAPFGENVKNALHFFLTKAKEMGFNTINYDNYMGEITFGEGEELGIIGHLDVVPYGDGWKTPPSCLTEKDGYFYGRGVHDDIGPCLACLYALKEIKDMGVVPQRKFRFFVGCDEETDWRDVEYFSSHYSFPEYGFSPDGDFPLSYAEKGVTVATFHFPLFRHFKDIKGGTVINAVCAYASVIADDKGIDKDKLKKFGLTLCGNKIESVGVSAHGSKPENGKNAIKPLLEYMGTMGEDTKNIIDCLFNDRFGISKLDTEQGKITVSPDLIEEKDGEILLSCDCRIPYPLSADDLTKIFDKFGIKYETETHHPTMCVDKDGWFVRTLISAYNEVTKEDGKPISLGGSTFARAFKYGVSFGPAFPDEENNIHNANESVKVENVEKFYDIYLNALLKLSKVK